MTKIIINDLGSTTTPTDYAFKKLTKKWLNYIIDIYNE